MSRCYERGWVRIGVMDSVGRRSLWARMTYADRGETNNVEAVELCAGREGDDAYLRVARGEPGYDALQEVISRALFAQSYIAEQVHQDPTDQRLYVNRYDTVSAGVPQLVGKVAVKTMLEQLADDPTAVSYMAIRHAVKSHDIRAALATMVLMLEEFERPKGIIDTASDMCDRFFGEGMDAAEMGKSLETCPHAERTLGRHWWTRGYAYVVRLLRALEAEGKLRDLTPEVDRG